ncbi:MAG: serine/threonine-protein kinase [Bacteroidota bacterium]
MHDLTLVDLYEAAASLDPEAREAFIRHLAEHRPDLTASLRALFDAPVPTGDVLLPMPALHLDPIEPGTQLGSFVVAEQIGEGGMGQVYRAVQEPLGRDVALKVVALGTYATPAQLQRFRAERDLVGSFDHPHIAHVYGGGETPDGVPYFAMELVEGQPITDWCAARRLAERDRVALFCQVCEAVAFAHQRLVVHRDIKPSNILVREDGAGRPIVKLLDFGIAAVLADPEEGTRAELGAMTPAYAAPEQARGEGITTATDVYALGVVLHELLTGHRPEVATERLDGDLGAIVTRALQDEPAHRYPSAQALADDLQRFLGRLPVQARPARAGYRVGRFVARHRSAVSAAVLATLVLIAVVGVYTWQLRAERDAAEFAQTRSENVTLFFAQSLALSSPTNNPGADTLSARDLVGQLGERALTEFEVDTPEKASILDVVGQLYTIMGNYEEAEPLLVEAVRIDEALSGTGSYHHARAQMSYGELLFEQGRFKEAQNVLRESVAGLRRAFPEGHRDLAMALHHFARTYDQLEQFDEARALYEDALAMKIQVFGPDHYEVTSTRSNLTNLLYKAGLFEEALPGMYAALEHRTREFGEGHVALATPLNNIGATYSALGRLAEAVPHYDRALVLRRQHYGDDHPQTALTLDNLGFAQLRLGEVQAAEANLDEAISIMERQGVRSHPLTATMLTHRGRLFSETGRLEAASRDLYEALAIREAAFEAGHSSIGLTKRYLGTLARYVGDLDAATKQLDEALAITTAALGEEHPNVGRIYIEQAHVKALQGDTEAALRLTRLGHDVLAGRLGSAHPEVQRASELIREQSWTRA